MVVWSCFKNIGKINTLGSTLASIKNVSKSKAAYYLPVRTSHGETLDIKASKFQLKKIKDLSMFYLMLGIIPLTGFVLLANIFIGPAELALIPEDYEPKHWEYYQNPVTRLMVKYLMMSPQERYERNLHNVFIDSEITQIKKLKRKVKQKMKERVDYQSWYYIPAHTRYPRKFAEDIEKVKKGEIGPSNRMIDFEE